MEDIIGKRYGRITVTSFVKRERHPKYNCSRFFYIGRCDCGIEKQYVRSNLISGHTKSCGCLKRRIGSDNPTFGGYGEIGASHWCSIKRHAETRGLDFNIEPSDAWSTFQQQDGKCALTGLHISMNTGRNPKSGAVLKTASLDRIDSSQGYFPENIQWVHKDINRMKNHFGNDRFIELCKLVANNIKS